MALGVLPAAARWPHLHRHTRGCGPSGQWWPHDRACGRRGIRRADSGTGGRM